jgi:light-independent protochlorophyllide reductase subunit B
MGFEGANVIFDTWVHPLVMGLEEHLLTMFREDPEFHDAAGASHHGRHLSRQPEPAPADEPPPAPAGAEVIWLADAEAELRKVPFFVRGKARRNTEKFAAERGVTRIGVETLYEAKAHYAR